MARGRPQGRSKSDQRVCQAALFARAAEYRKRISISPEEQEARIAAVNAECIVEDAPRRRRGQKARVRETKSGTVRVSLQGRCSEASCKAKKTTNKRLEHALGKAAGREPHTLYCHVCGATAELGLRGGKEGGSVQFSCRTHAKSNGCFRVDEDRTHWVEMRPLRAELARLKEELRQLGRASFTAPTTSSETWNVSHVSQSKGHWVSVPMSKSQIATLLVIGGTEVNPGPSADEIAQNKAIWMEAYPDIDTTLVDYLALKNIKLAYWRGLSAPESCKESLIDLEDRYERGGFEGEWEVSWNVFLRSVAAGGRRGQDGEAGHSTDVYMLDANQGNQNHAGPSGSVGPTGKGQVHVDQRNADQQRERKLVGDLTEGINARRHHGGAFAARVGTIENIIEAMEQLGAVLITAPPQSGKTSLLQLIENALVRRGGKVYYISLAQFSRAELDSFEDVWKHFYPEVDFDALVASPKTSPESLKLPAPPPPSRKYILVDEAQAAFGNPSLKLFRMLKDLRSGKSKSDLSILLVSAWGSKRIQGEGADVDDITPGYWDANNTVESWQKSGLEAALQFTKEEAEDYWARWMGVRGWAAYVADEEREFILAITERQPGAMSLLLDRIDGLGVLHVPEAEWHCKVQEWLHSEHLMDSVADLRSVTTLSKAIAGGIPTCSVEATVVKDLMRKMLHGGNSKVQSHELTNPQLKAAAILTKMGQLLVQGAIGSETFSLPSRLHVLVVTRQLYKGRAKNKEAILGEGIFEFVAAVVERLDPAQLRLSLSRRSEGSALYERQYQFSFYQAAMSCLPNDAVLSPDVGYFFGAQGYLDFLIGSPFRWGFELLREGDTRRRQEHLDRFTQGGRYTPLFRAKQMTEYAVIDICWKSGDRLATIPDHLVHVSFAPDFEQAVVRSATEEKRVTLKGVSSFTI